MGRHAGWLTAASSVWKKKESDSPHICLLPEVEFNEDKSKFIKTINSNSSVILIDKNIYNLYFLKHKINK